MAYLAAGVLRATATAPGWPTDPEVVSDLLMLAIDSSPGPGTRLVAAVPRAVLCVTDSSGSWSSTTSG